MKQPSVLDVVVYYCSIILTLGLTYILKVIIQKAVYDANKGGAKQ